MPWPNEKATYPPRGSLPERIDTMKMARSGKTDARPKPSPSGRQSVLSKPPIRYRATPKIRPRKKRVLAVQIAGRCCRRSASRDFPLCLEGSRRDQREVSHVAMMPPATPLRTGRIDSNSIGTQLPNRRTHGSGYATCLQSTLWRAFLLRYLDLRVAWFG